VKAEETKYMLMSRNQNKKTKSQEIMANKSFEDMVIFKYWETKETNQNLILEEL
jgi:hypothetical protein